MKIVRQRRDNEKKLISGKDKQFNLHGNKNPFNLPPVSALVVTEIRKEKKLVQK